MDAWVGLAAVVGVAYAVAYVAHKAWQMWKDYRRLVAVEQRLLEMQRAAILAQERAFEAQLGRAFAQTAQTAALMAWASQAEKDIANGPH